MFAEKFNFFGFFWLFVPFALYLAASRSANFRHNSDNIKIASASLVLFISSISILQYVFKINPFKAPLPYATFGNPMYLGAWLAMLLPLCADAWFAERERKSEAINPDKSEKFPLNQIPSAPKIPLLSPFFKGGSSSFSKRGIPFSKGRTALISSRAGRRNLFFLASFSGFIVLMMTRSQAAYAGFLAGIIYLFLKRWGFRRALLPAAFLTTVIFCLYGGFFKKGDSALNNSILRRERYYKTTLNMIKENPARGVGFGNYRGSYAKHRMAAGLPLHPSPEWAHCDILHFAAELGIFRAAIYLFFVLSVLFKKTENDKIPYKAAVLSMVAASFIGFPFQRISTLAPFFIFSGIIVSSSAGRAPRRFLTVRRLAVYFVSAALMIFSLIFAWSEREWKKGLNCIDAGEYRKAAEHLENAKVFIRNDYRLLHLLGQTEYRQGNYAAALRAYADCLSLYFDWDICYNFALALRASGDEAEAGKFFKIAGMLNPELADVKVP